MQPGSDKHILTERELALRWHRSQRTLQRWRNLGTGPAWMKIGYGVVYLLTDVIAHETQSRRDPSEAK